MSRTMIQFPAQAQLEKPALKPVKPFLCCLNSSQEPTPQVFWVNRATVLLYKLLVLSAFLSCLTPSGCTAPRICHNSGQSFRSDGTWRLYSRWNYLRLFLRGERRSCHSRLLVHFLFKIELELTYNNILVSGTQHSMWYFIHYEMISTIRNDHCNKTS